MKLYEKVAAFAGKHGLAVNGPDITSVIDGLLYDMEAGLAGEDALGKPAAQDMIPTWTNPPEAAPKNQSVIVIDAGGTNFRTCLVSFDGEGNPSISELKKSSMPGIEREFSKKEFFDTIAANLDYLKDRASRIGFCFSYAMKITPENDGEVLSFSKEIKAKEVVGSLVGKSISDAIVERYGCRPFSRSFAGCRRKTLQFLRGSYFGNGFEYGLHRIRPYRKNRRRACRYSVGTNRRL